MTLQLIFVKDLNCQRHDGKSKINLHMITVWYKKVRAEKHGGGGIMYGCFGAEGIYAYHNIDGIMHGKRL